MPGQITTTRQQQVLVWQAGSPVLSPQLGIGQVYRELAVTLEGTITSNTMNYMNTASNIAPGDEWKLVSEIQVMVNGSDTIFVASGEELRAMNAFWYERPPRISENFIGSNVTSSAFGSTLILPFWDPRSRSPIDMLLDSGKLADLRVQVRWAASASSMLVNATAGVTTPAFTTNPTLRITSRECYGIQSRKTGKTPNFSLRRRFKIPNSASVAAQNDYRVFLTPGMLYRGFFINTKDANGYDLAGCIDRVVLKSGTRSYIDARYRTMQDWMNLRGYRELNMVDSTKAALPFAHSSKSDLGGWMYLDLLDDGYVTEGIDTINMSELYLSFDVNQTITSLNVIPEAVIPYRK